MPRRAGPAPLVGYVDRPAFGVDDERPVGRGADGGDQVGERAEREGLVRVPGRPPAHRPAVEAVDHGRQVGLEAVRGELGHVGDGEQARLGGQEVVGAVRAQRQVRGPLRELAAVAAVPGPPRDLGGLAGHEPLLGHDRADDLLRGHDGGVAASLSASLRHETGSPGPDLMSAATLSAPCVPPLASNEALTRALSAAFGSGRASRARLPGGLPGEELLPVG